MRKRDSILKVLAILSVIMFVINALMMRMLFGVNIIGNHILHSVYPAEFEPARTEAYPTQTETIPSQTEANPAQADTEDALYALTPDEINSLRHLSLPDKITAASILSKLSTEEIDRIIRMSADGITYDEYEELKTLAEIHLDSSDIKALEKILFSSDSGRRSCLNQFP